MATQLAEGFILREEIRLITPHDCNEKSFIPEFKLDSSLKGGFAWEVIMPVMSTLKSIDQPFPVKEYSIKFCEMTKNTTKANVIDFMDSQKSLSFGFVGSLFIYSVKGRKFCSSKQTLIFIDKKYVYLGTRPTPLPSTETGCEIVGFYRYPDHQCLRFEAIEYGDPDPKFEKGSIVPLYYEA